MIKTILVSYLCVWTSYTQTELSGTIKDEVSKEPLPFVHVYLESNPSLGTVSNLEGDFIIKIPENSDANNLVFSSIGFKTKILRISELKLQEETIIFLNSHIEELESVVLVSKNLSAKRILRKALRRIPKNYVNKAYQQLYFYRQINYTNDRVSRIIEALLRVEDKGYLENLDSIKLAVLQLRKTPDLGTPDLAAIFFQKMTTSMGNPFFALNRDFVRGANTKIRGMEWRRPLFQRDSIFNVFKEFELSIEKVVEYKTDMTYVLRLKNSSRLNSSDGKKKVNHLKFIEDLASSLKLTGERKKLFMDRYLEQFNSKNGTKDNVLDKGTYAEIHNSVRAYINTKDFAIIRIEQEVELKYFKNNVYEKSSFSSATINYKKLNDNYWLHNINVRANDLQKGFNQNKNWQFTEYELSRTSNVNTDNKANNLNIYINPWTDIYDYNLPYNELFWNSYNSIKTKPLNLSLFGSSDIHYIFNKN